MNNILHLALTASGEGYDVTHLLSRTARRVSSLRGHLQLAVVILYRHHPVSVKRRAGTVVTDEY